MREATLCFLIKGDRENKEILLAMKKRGFGAGKWNGVGGKIDLEKGDKDIIDTAVRETKEEIGVKVRELDRVAVINFHFPYKEEWNQQVHVFFVKKWEGEPKESEEMSPQWFRTDEIPFEGTWDDDKYWLPQALRGKKLKADFVFKEGETIDKQKIKIVKKI